MSTGQVCYKWPKIYNWTILNQSFVLFSLENTVFTIFLVLSKILLYQSSTIICPFWVILKHKWWILHIAHYTLHAAQCTWNTTHCAHCTLHLRGRLWCLYCQCLRAFPLLPGGITVLQTTWRRNWTMPWWHDMTWHDMTWHDMTWYDMTWHDMTWHDMTQTPHLPILCPGHALEATALARSFQARKTQL